MLPDLLPMAGLRGARAYRNRAVEEGHQFHVVTDALFHATPTFVNLNRAALQDLRRLGVSTGPARACAHMGVEMLIDAELVKNGPFFSSYEGALRTSLSTPDLLLPLLPDELIRARHLCEHLHKSGCDVFATSVDRFAVRLSRTLASRPRLLPTPRELAIISEYLAASADYSLHVHQLLDELQPLRDHEIADFTK